MRYLLQHAKRQLVERKRLQPLHRKAERVSEIGLGTRSASAASDE